MVGKKLSRKKSSSRKGRTVRSVNYQRGKSDKRKDAKRSALKPGKRKSRSGKKYWETRRNRSDRNPKLRL